MLVTNGDIFGARHLVEKDKVRDPLGELIATKIPVMVSYRLAKLAIRLSEPLKVIEDVRNGLVKKYGESDDKGQVSVNQEGENFAKFADEFNELMTQEVEVVFEKVKLPEKSASTCDKCHHNMDKPFEIEPIILMSLDKFVEV